MTRHDALFAAIEADPSPIVETAIDRLILDRGRPTTETESALRFGRKGSLWIDRTTGDWHDWENDLGGGSWKLALYVGLTADDIAAAALYLASDDARAVTGHTQVVDAGVTTSGFTRSPFHTGDPTIVRHAGRRDPA